MGIKIKNKSRRGRGRNKAKKAVAQEAVTEEPTQVASRLTGEAAVALEEAARRLNPRPTPGNWKKMVQALATQKSLEGYVDQFISENREELGWEWATLWICHTFICEAGMIELAKSMYTALIENFPRDYHTEMAYARMKRDFLGEYFEARDHMRYATVLWPEGCEGYYQLGILYDLLGMPEFAFAMEERAYTLAEQFGDTAYRLRAQLSFNQAVAMWQAARPYGDIKAYLRRALEQWPSYERAQKFLDSLPEDDEADPKGRSAMQRLTDDVKRDMNKPSYYIIEPDAG